MVRTCHFWVQNCKSKVLKILALSKGTTCWAILQVYRVWCQILNSKENINYL